MTQLNAALSSIISTESDVQDFSIRQVNTGSIGKYQACERLTHASLCTTWVRGVSGRYSSVITDASPCWRASKRVAPTLRTLHDSTKHSPKGSVDVHHQTHRRCSY